jgi:hypothetical protein
MITIHNIDYIHNYCLLFAGDGPDPEELRMLGIDPEDLA